jgi:predicted outer membrane repeat protein
MAYSRSRTRNRKEQAMWFSSWIRKRISTWTPRSRTPHRLAAPRFRPRLEALDDRIVPAQVSLTVTSLADAGPGTLRAAILAADAGKAPDKFTIDFAVSGTIDLLSPLPALDNTIAIQGPGAGSLTIQRDSGVPFAARIISVEAGQSASLSGVTIAHGDHGGIANDGTLAVSNCILSENSTTVGGGGGIVNDFLATLTVSGCTLCGNAAPQGGGIFNDGTMAVSTCTLSDNSATLQGGGIANAGTLTVSGSTLSSNSTTGGGGGIVNDNGAAILTVSGCTLSDNTAGTGGGINNFGMLTVSGSTLSDNHTRNAGGSNSPGTLDISSSCLSGNSALANGGGIRCGGTTTVSRCLLSGNTAGDSGGAIDNLGTATLQDSTLSGNTATEGGGIYNDASGTLAVRGCSFSGNTAGDSGGGLYNLGTATVQESTLSANTAGSAGGGISNAASGALVIDDSMVCGNVAPAGADLYNLGVVTLNDSTVCVIGP